MLKKPQSTTFKFILSHEQLFNNLDHLKMNNYDRFIRVGETGKKIQELAKADEHKQLQKLCDANAFEIQFMRLEIEDAFVSALHLRNENTVDYFLSNGIMLDQIDPGCIIELCYSLQYLSHDPPTDLLTLLLQYGGNARFADQNNSDTSLHIAAKYGNVEFIKLLLMYGADINAANNEKITPLGCALAGKQKAAIQYLKSKNASEKWNV